jgi:protein AaeX
MLRETAFGGALMPSTLPCALLSVVLFIAFDRIANAIGFYKLFWHAALARVALFTCLFVGVVLLSRTIGASP